MNDAVAIVNPRSSNGKAAEAWARVRAQLSRQVDVLETEHPGDAIQLTRSVLKKGARTIIAVGGDGTVNEVVNGFFEGDALISPDAAIGVVPYGTGSDLRRSLNLPCDESRVASVIEAGVPRSIDAMRVRFTMPHGETTTRYAINLTSLGMGGAVAARANRTSKALGGKVSFLLSTLITTFEYSGKPVTLILDGKQKVETLVTNVAVGNGRYHGGGMLVCPRAELNDGLLDVTVIRYLNLFEITTRLPMLYNGKILEHPKVRFYQARHIRAESAETTAIEIDGEPLGKLPMEIEVLPSALRVLY